MLVPDEGYFFGMGAFETIAVEQGNPVLLSQHYERLQRAMDFLKLHHSMEEIRVKADDVLADAEMKEGRMVLKITVSDQNILVSKRKNTYGPEDYRRGFSAVISNVRRNETSPFTYHKTLNYGDCLLEKRRVKAEGADEPIFLNLKGVISEGATTNVFFVKNGRLLTPSVDCGILPGIVRDYVCRRFEAEEREILPREISECEEMFLTNSLLGIMPVRSFEDHVFEKQERGRRILELYCRECTGGYLKA